MKIEPHNWSNLFFAKTLALLDQTVLEWANPEKDPICYVIPENTN